MFQSAEHKRRLLARLWELGVRTVVVEYDGYGDSGSIEKPSYLDERGVPKIAGHEQIVWPKRSGRFDRETGVWITSTQEQPLSLDEVLVDLVNDTLDEKGIDWYNNDGGYGELRIDMNHEKPTIELDIKIRYTEVSSHDENFTDEWEKE